ncbi:hypothetical protein LUZ60_007803 [Juncus effusus]|nr:hypothetical protein LUZ60_007803 [Juncus effusus]
MVRLEALGSDNAGIEVMEVNDDEYDYMDEDDDQDQNHLFFFINVSFLFFSSSSSGSDPLHLRPDPRLPPPPPLATPPASSPATSPSLPSRLPSPILTRLQFLLSPIVGWFSYRRNTSPRPSMRELAVSSSLAKTLETNNNIPCVFLLLSSSNSPNRAVHTHVYKAFVVLKQGERSVLQPVSLKVINVGPSSSGGQYGNFTPELSPLPLMPCSVRATEDLHFNPCSEGEKKKSKKEESLGDLKEKARGQKTLDSVSDGFGVERLEKLVTGNSYTNELEDLYCSMLSKLEGLVRQVEKSSIRVSDQENRNLELRCKLAGME